MSSSDRALPGIQNYMPGRDGRVVCDPAPLSPSERQAIAEAVLPLILAIEATRTRAAARTIPEGVFAELRLDAGDLRNQLARLGLVLPPRSPR